MEVIENYSLKEVNTFGVDQSSRYFSQVHSVDDLQELLAKYPQPYILGGGSNILLTRDLDRLVIQNGLRGIAVVDENEDHVWVEIKSGENWHRFVQAAVTRGWGGIENLSLIPGTVGAAPIQNIGAYGVEIKNVLVSVDVIDLETNQQVSFTAEACQFDYRHSFFKLPAYRNRYFITSVLLQLHKKSTPNIKYADVEKKLLEWSIVNPSIVDVHEAVVDIRRNKLPDPEVIGNAGSFFKNPIIPKNQFEKLQLKYANTPHYPVDQHNVKLPAGWLIDQAGWKGKKVGPVGCYEKQALVIVNHGGATGSQIWAFAQLIQNDVMEKFDVSLEPEINIW